MDKVEVVHIYNGKGEAKDDLKKDQMGHGDIMGRGRRYCNILILEVQKSTNGIQKIGEEFLEMIEKKKRRKQ